MQTKFTEQQKAIALGVIVVFTVLYIDFAFILKSQMQSLKAASGKLTQLKAVLTQYARSSSFVKGAQADSASLENKQAQLNKYLFSDSDVPLIIDDISQKAASLGIKIMRINPHTVTSPDGEKISDDVGRLNLYPLFLKLQLVAGYHQLGAFLSRTELNPCVSIAQLKAASLPGDPLKLHVECTLKIYVKK